MCKVSSRCILSSVTILRDRETGAGPYWVPLTDVYLSDGGIVIKVELAGMRREDLELTVEGNHLKISGQRPDVSSENCFFSSWKQLWRI